jgi:hypothetical protein
MISIRKNPNMTRWFQVFSFGRLVDEFDKKSRAIRLAESLAKEVDQEAINVEGLLIKVRER